MSLTNAPPMITQFSTQLQACASWTAASLSTNVWYPEAPEGTAGPYVVLGFASGQRFEKHAEGVTPIPSSDLFFTVWKADTTGNLETLVGAILSELLTQVTGIPFRSGDGMNAAEVGAARSAAGETLYGVSATVSQGLVP